MYPTTRKQLDAIERRLIELDAQLESLREATSGPSQAIQWRRCYRRLLALEHRLAAALNRPTAVV